MRGITVRQKDIEATIESIDTGLSPSVDVNITALAECLALQIIMATSNNVEAAYKFVSVAERIKAIINDRAPLA
jgi:hypothetical protein